MRIGASVLAATGLLAAGVAVVGPGVAGAAVRPTVGQACATDLSKHTVCYGGPAAIQTAIDSSGEGWTVEVGPGHFEEHLHITRGIRLKGQGDETVMDGVLDDAANRFIIDADDPADHSFAAPLRIEGLKFRVPATAVNPNYAAIIHLKDKNALNDDVVYNNIFETEGACRVIGVWSENAAAMVKIDHNSFRYLTNGVLLESGSQTTPALVQYNRFTHQSDLEHGIESLGVEVHSGANAAGSARQDISRNNFDFQWAPAESPNWGIYVDGQGDHIDIHADSNNFDQPTYGIFNANSATAVHADRDWWNCAAGPAGSCPQVSTTAGNVVVTNARTRMLSLKAGDL